MAAFKSRIIPIDEMREPTNLEVAQLVMASAQSVIAMTQYLLVAQNLIASDEEKSDAILDLTHSSEILQTWWMNLSPTVGEGETENDETV